MVKKKEKKKKTITFKQFQNLNRKKLVETEVKWILLANTHDCSLYWLRTGISIKRVKSRFMDDLMY